MLGPRQSPRKGSWLSRLDWKVLVISRKAIYIWIGVIALCFLASLILFLFLRGSSISQKAKRAIVSAEKALEEASQAGVEIFDYYKYSQATLELSKAKKAYDAGDFKTAYDHANKAELMARRAQAELREQGILTSRFASVAALSGKVEIKRPKDLSWQPASPGMKLSTDDQIRTFANAQAQIAFDDINTLRVKPNSLIVIGQLSEDVSTRTRKTSIRLMISEIEARIKKSDNRPSEFQIEMPSAVAKVERANLAVKVTPENESHIRIFSGAANILSGGKNYRLETNQEARVTQGSQIVPSSQPLVTSPTLITPTNMKMFSFPNPREAKVTFAWSEVLGAKAYHLEISQDPFFFDSIFNLKDLPSVVYEAERLDPGTYFWRVSSLNSQGSEGSSSDQEAFQIKYAAEGTPFRIDSLLVLVGRDGNVLSIQGTTEPMASVTINNISVQSDKEGRFRIRIAGISIGSFLAIIQVVNQKGSSATFRREIPVGI